MNPLARGRLGFRQGRDPCDGGAGIPALAGRGPRSGGQRTGLRAPAGAELRDELLDRHGPQSCQRAVLGDPNCAGRHAERLPGLLGGEARQDA